MDEATTTVERREALREALIAAAENRIAASGYRALRARDLACDVGCAVGAIYLVFPDLDALVAAVKDRTVAALERRAADIAAEARGGTASGGTGRERDEAMQNLKALGTLYLRFARENRNLWRALFEHRPAADAESAAPAKLGAIFAHVERQLDALAPDRPHDKRRLLAQALLGAVHGVVTLALQNAVGSPSEADVAWQVEEIVELAARGLAASGPGRRAASARRDRATSGMPV